MAIDLTLQSSGDIFSLNEALIIRVYDVTNGAGVEFANEITGRKEQVNVTQTKTGILNSSLTLVAIDEFINNITQNYLINVNRIYRFFPNIEDPDKIDIDYEFDGSTSRVINSSSDYTTTKAAIDARKGNAPQGITGVVINYILLDEVNGNDATAVKYDLTKPYKTITAANTAATFGDNIVGVPGDYSSYNGATYNLLGKDGVDWDFFAGATIDAVFSDQSITQVYSITGYGTFTKTETDGDANFKWRANGTSVNLYFLEATNTSTAGNVIEYSPAAGALEGKLSVYGTRVFSDPQYGILIGNVCNADIHIDDIESTNSFTVYVVNGHSGTINIWGDITNIDGNTANTSALYMSHLNTDTSIVNMRGNISYTGTDTNATSGVANIDRGVFNHYSGEIIGGTKTALKSGRGGNQNVVINLHTNITATTGFAFDSNNTLMVATFHNSVMESAHLSSTVSMQSGGNFTFLDCTIENTDVTTGGAVTTNNPTIEVEFSSARFLVNSASSGKALSGPAIAKKSGTWRTNATIDSTLFINNNPTGTTQTIDWSESDFQRIGLTAATGDVVTTFINGVPGQKYTLEVQQGAVARNIITTALTPGGTAPNTIVISAGNGDIDLLTFEVKDDNTTYIRDHEKVYG